MDGNANKKQTELQVVDRFVEMDEYLLLKSNVMMDHRII